MSLYTKVGDQGSTRFPDGRLGRKSEPVVAALGSLDELNSHVGLCLCEARARGFVEIVDALTPLQPQIMTLSATLVQTPSRGAGVSPALCVPCGLSAEDEQPFPSSGNAGETPAPREGKPFTVPLDPAAIGEMENLIDEITAALGPLKRLLVPGGSELACRLHVARTVCRRAERDLVAVNDHQRLLEPPTLPFINRLSDLLFNLARLANHQTGC